jgi:ribosomal protein S18 acetylase RimI-like enzyme
MPTRHVRRAREKDLDGLIELGRRSWLSAFAQTAPFPLIAWWIREDRVARLYEQHWRDMTVLEQDGAIIGLVQPMGSEINGLWVDPKYQGTGVGTLLLRSGEEIIERAGHKTAWLVCSAWNPKALEFYQRRRYIETGREHGTHACGVSYEAIRMERLLHEGVDAHSNSNPAPLEPKLERRNSSDATG